jgi:hypothetical protein
MTIMLFSKVGLKYIIIDFQYNYENIFFIIFKKFVFVFSAPVNLCKIYKFNVFLGFWTSVGAPLIVSYLLTSISFQIYRFQI